MGLVILGYSWGPCCVRMNRAKVWVVPVTPNRQSGQYQRAGAKTGALCGRKPMSKPSQNFPKSFSHHLGLQGKDSAAMSGKWAMPQRGQLLPYSGVPRGSAPTCLLPKRLPLICSTCHHYNVASSPHPLCVLDTYKNNKVSDHTKCPGSQLQGRLGQKAEISRRGKWGTLPKPRDQPLPP